MTTGTSRTTTGTGRTAAGTPEPTRADGADQAEDAGQAGCADAAERADQAARADRVRGCLLGGALGDALGWPVEFQRLERILDRHGPEGVRSLAFAPGGLAEVTDDTQMTLFTAEGLLQAGEATSAAVLPAVHAAYRRWLRTQCEAVPQPDATGLLAEAWLYASRAPGNACLSGLEAHVTPPAALPVALGRRGPVNPDSKGCGTVMRSAPFGLLGLGPDRAFRLAADCAQLTHGHPTGALAAGAFAALVDRLVGGAEPRAAVVATIAQTAGLPGAEETVADLERAVRIADEGVPDFDAVERVGLGWIAEECLAIGVHGLLAAAETGPRRALTLSVTHSGDSDSTGSVCGNLLGAAYGAAALPQDWLDQIEGTETLLRIADLLVATSSRP
ncbi:ADP-ribosylglycohydrolase family protein [Streptacidiphilus jiangxiensis]|uniref:ADP-ribosylglycohydrolase n=1 Tax=Streptacidiphilus jiangxiensis TaxID=235985 RepID=A0A1H7RCD4_STRJI|nr:ADP-ribosylglycohydrolase family protein [Streptacidiphilus jiangxiensis]SEL57759.1 ADP-ribosylglycohydrolase [Streptacidiphilus jiangxiensis]